MIRWRINLILAVLLVLGAVLIGRLFYIQVVKGDFYRALAQGLYSIEAQVIGERGQVFLKNGETLAINIDWLLVFVSPAEIREDKEKEIIAEKLAEILLLDKNFILEKLEKNSLYEPIKKRISEQEAQKIKEENIKGVYLGGETGRYYPQETLAAQLIGFLDADLRGQYGIEGHYNDILQGKRNQKGEDIFLTVDYAIQFRAEDLLKQAKENLDIEGGEIIVMNPNSGEIIALANFPVFNPNQYSEVQDFKIFKNGVTQKIFEPGSVFKPITMAGALEEERITPQTTYIDEGFIKIGGHTVYNYDKRVWGEQSMTEVLEKSINTGVIFAEKRLGHNLFLRYLEGFGFFKPTGIDLQEIYSENREFKKGYEINFATASFGQGVEITPIQLITAFSAIANGGKIVTPYIVKKTGKIENIVEKESIISPKTSAQLTKMLVDVTENGFAKSARVSGYYVAGKTGTAQISFASLGENKKGYSDKTWQSFVGFAPAFSPEFVILVKLNNPKAKTAEYSAVPIFQNLAKYIIDYYQIPPDY